VSQVVWFINTDRFTAVIFLCRQSAVRSPIMAAVNVPCLATAAESVKLWNIESFALNHEFCPHLHQITSLSWSSDGNVSFPVCVDLLFG